MALEERNLLWYRSHEVKKERIDECYIVLISLVSNRQSSINCINMRMKIRLKNKSDFEKNTLSMIRNSISPKKKILLFISLKIAAYTST